MMRYRLTVFLALLTALAGIAATGAEAPARIAMFHDGGGSHESGQMRAAAQSWGALAVIDEFAPGAGNPVFDADVDLAEYDLVFVDGADATTLTEAEIADAREDTRLLVLDPQGATYGNVSLEEHADVERYWNKPLGGERPRPRRLSGGESSWPAACPWRFPRPSSIHASGCTTPTHRVFSGTPVRCLTGMPHGNRGIATRRTP